MPDYLLKQIDRNPYEVKSIVTNTKKDNYISPGQVSLFVAVKYCIIYKIYLNAFKGLNNIASLYI